MGGAARGSFPVGFMLLETIIEQGARRGSQIAMVDDVRSTTFRELVMGGQILADYLDSLATGERHIGLMIPQSGAFAMLFLATRWSDRVAVPLNYLLRPTELLEVCGDANLKTVFTIRHPLFAELAAAMEAAGIRVIYVQDLLPVGFLTKAKAVLFRRRLPKRDPADPAVILYTSGTSSAPKGVVLTNGNLDSNAANSIAHARFNQQMTFLGVLPMFHALGLMGCCLVPLSLGCRVVYMARFSAQAVFQAVEKHQVQVLIAVPSMYALLANAKSARREMLASVRYAISGGEPLSLSLMDRFAQHFGISILEGFGLTETSPMVSFSTPWDHKPGSVGKPIPQQQLRIVDESGADLPAGQDGELLVKGPNVMRGYYNKPMETAAVLSPDGWFKTGDIARLDPDGFLHITGRKKEMIIMAGEKIAPGEIEEILRQHPAVLLVAVVGVKDPQRGEVPVAFIQLEPDLPAKPTASEIRAFVRQRLAPYKTPRDVYFLNELPRSPTGKILKRALVVPPLEVMAQAETPTEM